MENMQEKNSVIVLEATIQEEKSFLSLPLYVTFTKSREPLDMKSSGILDSIYSILQKLFC